MLSLSDFRAGTSRLGAGSYTAMTNEKNDSRAIAYEFESIYRGQDLIPLDNELKAPPFIKKWWQLSYEYPGRSEDTESFVRYRFISENSPWRWSDICGGRRRVDGPGAVEQRTRGAMEQWSRGPMEQRDNRAMEQ
jgi:hypothetical protein